MTVLVRQKAIFDKGCVGQNFSGGPTADVTKWVILLKGPVGSAYEGLTMKVHMDLTDYPLRAPVVKFEGKMFHPSVDAANQPCMHLLNPWAPMTSILALAQALEVMLMLPVAGNILNAVAEAEYRKGEEAFKAAVKKHTTM